MQTQQQPQAPGLGKAMDTFQTCAPAACQEEYRQDHQRKYVIPRKRREELAGRILALGVTPGKGFLSKLSDKLKEYGIEQPTVQIEFRQLTVATDALVGNAGIPTVANVGTHALKRLLRQDKQQKTEMTILKGVTGVLKPGHFTLLLGPPGSGKSTLLKVLGARLKPSRHLRISGGILYNGHRPDEFLVERTTAYVDQHDNHIANLTVSETLDFAHDCQTGRQGHAFNLPDEIRRAKTIKGNAGSPSADANTGTAEANTLAGKQDEGTNSAHGTAQLIASSTTSTDSLRQQLPQKNSAGSSWLYAIGDCKSSALQVPPRAGSKSKVTEDDIERLISDIWGTGVKTEVVMKLLGLAHCKDTLVGDALLRGVSGGERKRVTTAEMVVGPRRVLLMDEISTGLDSATLYDVITFFGAMTHGMQLTTLVSLLQPPPEVFALFDDLLLLTDGHIIYHGPIAEALPFFSSLGFRCPERKDVPSFLLEITTPAGQEEFAAPELKAACVEAGSLHRSSYAGKQLLVLLEDMVSRFWSDCPAGHRMAEELEHPFDRNKSHPAALEHERYALTPWQAISAVTRRQAALVMRDKVLLKGRIMQVIIIGLFCGSLFFNLGHSPEDARTFLGASFMAVMFMSMGAMPQLALVLASKPVWFKHRDNYFYPAYAHGVAMAITQFPLSIIDASLFSLITYFMIGYYRDAAYFFAYWVIIICSSLSMSAIMRLLAVLAPNATLANAYGGILLLMLILNSGFTIVRTSIPGWWIWAYYISPFAYGIRSVIVNEFTAPVWSDPMPGTNGQYNVGEAVLLSFGFFTDRSWIWGGIGFMFGSYLLLSAITCVALGWVTGETTVAQVADEKQLQQLRAEADVRRQELVKVRGAAAPAVAATAASQPHATDEQVTGTAAAAGTTGMDISSSLPFQPITLVFRDLRYYVPNPAYNAGCCGRPPKPAAKAAGAGKPGPDVESGDGAAAAAAGTFEPLEVPAKLELLKGITGYAVPGELMALMGGSGAGKTTLMDVICGRKTVGQISGTIMVNGHPKVQRTWSRVVGYVEQMDIHTAAQTVVEALWFSARLRLPPTVSDKQVRAYVEEVMDIVDMMDICYSLVGSPAMGTGLSIEQRKRLTIAVELVANPSVVFMDEPTSGLDARAAAIVMRAVRNVARNGRTVMVTIHQPSIEIFEAFDTMLLLQRGGRTTYFGDLGHESSKLIKYLEAVPGTPAIAPGHNPATWMLEVTGGSMATLTQYNAKDWPALYAGSSLCATNKDTAQRLVAEGAAKYQPLSVSATYAQLFGVQVRELLAKYWLVYWRTPSYNFTRTLLTLVVSLVYGSMYYKQGNIPEPATIANVQNVMGILFSSTNFLGMTNMMAVMPVVGSERVVFYREFGASPYDPFAYGLTIALVELPYLAVQASIFTPIIYFMIGFQSNAEKFFLYYLMFLCSIALYTIFGQFLVYVTPSQPVAQVLGAGLNFMYNIFNGFVITYPAIPVYWQWINRAVPTTWVLYGLGVSQLGNVENALNYPGRAWTVSEYVRVQFGFDYGLRWWCVLIVFAYVVFYRVTSILALKYINFLKR
eukprot:jgi/Chrzof1/5933/Cz16g21030.t1